MIQIKSGKLFVIQSESYIIVIKKEVKIMQKSIAFNLIESNSNKNWEDN